MATDKSSKPRGRTSSYAYFVQKCREESKKKNQTLPFSEFSKKCSEQWKKMSETEKKKFVQLAEKDKKRYTAEMENYVPPKGGDKLKGKKAKKDPNAPKRGLSAFFLYCNDERANVKATMPDASVGDVAKQLGKQWKAISEPQRHKYEAAAEKEKVRYEREMKAYKAKGGASSARGPAKKATAKSAVKSKKQVVDVSESEEEEEEEEPEEEEDEEDEEEEEEEDDD